MADACIVYILVFKGLCKPCIDLVFHSVYGLSFQDQTEPLRKECERDQKLTEEG